MMLYQRYRRPRLQAECAADEMPCCECQDNRTEMSAAAHTT